MRACLSIIDRANWGRLAPLAAALHAEPWMDLQIICGGSTVNPVFGECAIEIQQKYPGRVTRVYHEVAGGNSLAMACSVDVAAYARELDRLKPDCAIMIGDRHEGLAFAVASSELCLPLVHIQGGEVSGGVDNKRRYAITSLADYHVPATEASRERLYDCGVGSNSIIAVGCPSTDVMANLGPDGHNYSNRLVVMYHPDTRTPDEGEGEFIELMNAVDKVHMVGGEVVTLDPHSVVFWPNCDAGSGRIAQVIKRRCRDYERALNYTPTDFYRTLRAAGVCVGNSSSFVRDAGFFGTPVVLVGDRQEGRECGENVVRVPAKSADILAAIESQYAHGRYEPSTLYGDGKVSQRIIAALRDRFQPQEQQSLVSLIDQVLWGVASK